MAQDCDGVRKLQVQGHRPQGFGNSPSQIDFRGFEYIVGGIADRLGIWGFGFVVIFLPFGIGGIFGKLGWCPIN